MNKPIINKKKLIESVVSLGMDKETSVWVMKTYVDMFKKKSVGHAVFNRASVHGFNNQAGYIISVINKKNGKRFFTLTKVGEKDE